MAPLPDLYEILQVSPRAEPEVVEAAYHRLARKYHPDVSATPNAEERMKQLNLAYEIVSDPAKRAAYDAGRLSPPDSSNRETPGDPEGAPSRQDSGQSQPSWSAPPEPLVNCQRCGKITTTLRLTVFTYVISLLIMSFRRGHDGIYCDSCRRIKGVQFSAISLLLGPWGIPWGILWTLQALWRNASGGIQPAHENAGLLKLLALQFLRADDTFAAKECLRQSLALEEDAKTHEFLSELDRGFPYSQPKPTETVEPVRRSVPGDSSLPGFVRVTVVLVALLLVAQLLQPYVSPQRGLNPVEAVPSQMTPSSTPMAPTASTPTPVRSQTIRDVMLTYGRALAPIIMQHGRIVNDYNSLNARASWMTKVDYLGEINRLSRELGGAQSVALGIRPPEVLQEQHVRLANSLARGITFMNQQYSYVQYGMSAASELDALRQQLNEEWADSLDAIFSVFSEYGISLAEIGYTSVPTHTPAPSPTPTPRACIANTDGDGVILRYDRRMDAHSKFVYQDGTVITVLSWDATWSEIVGPDQYRGFIPTKYWDYCR